VKWPDFIIIGAMKCGTTALWRNCECHPDITMGKNPDDPKKTSTEIRFWNNGDPHRVWKKGFEWYKNLFSNKCSGEKCANYVESPKTIERMKRHIPDVKLVLCVRDPIARILSEFWMHNFKPEKISKFPKFARQHNILRRGEYITQLRRSVLDWFPRDQIYVVVQERMKNNTVSEMNKLYKWLGLETHDEVISRLPFGDRDKNVVGYRNWSTTHGVDMSVNTRKELADHYRGHNVSLFKFMGEEISEWG